MVNIFSWWQAFIPARFLIYFLQFLLWLPPLVHVLFHALFDFHPLHCDKKIFDITEMFCSAFICISLIKSKNDNEAAGNVRHFFKSNWHTENLSTMKPTSWLGKKQLIFFFLSEFFFLYKAMFLPYRF